MTMLDLKVVRSNLQDIKEMIRNRGYDLDISRFDTLDQERKERLAVLEALRCRRNRASEEIALMKKSGNNASHAISEMKAVAADIKEKEKDLPRFVEELESLLQLIPNIPDASVPVGKDEKDNPVIRIWGSIENFAYKPLPHWEIGENLGILDFARARQALRKQVCPLPGSGRRHGAGANQFHAPHSYGGAWLYGNSPPPSWSTPPPCSAPVSCPNSKRTFSK